MIESEGYSFKSHNLSDLQIGSLDMGVPLHKKIVQLNALREHREDKTRLDVDISESMIVIKRQDDEPLQVQYRGPGVNTDKRVKVFKKPISDLVLIRGRSKNEWISAEKDVSINNDVAFDNFLYQVSLVAGWKQAPELDDDIVQ
ncbi:MAG: hypothetical protein JWN26_754 [Candidatus Saccharibacteria bacterium]|nr:hypothetical protein [Candidatus Saccharibacteria bacterium]